MPAVSAKQKRFFGAEMGRLKAGKPTKTGMSESQLKDYVSQPIAHSPKARSGGHMCSVCAEQGKPGMKHPTGQHMGTM